MSTVTAELTPDWAPDVIEALYEEAFENDALETAGVLVGRPTDFGAPHITALIPAVRCRAPGQRALLSHEAWAHVHATMGRHYPSEEIVGWYRSRPAGTALAAEDLATHLRYFTQPWQVAFLFDSTARRGAVYAMRGGELSILHQGRVTPRATREQPAGIPWRAMVVLAVLGLVLGAVVWLAASAIGVL